MIFHSKSCYFETLPVAVANFQNRKIYSSRCVKNFIFQKNLSWNSKYDMIERYLKLRFHVNNVISNSATQRLKTQKYLLSNEEVRLAEFLIVVLQPFKSITNLLSHSKLSNSRIIPCLVFLIKKLQCNQSDCEDLKEIFMRKIIYVSLSKFFHRKIQNV